MKFICGFYFAVVQNFNSMNDAHNIYQNYKIKGRVL